MGSGSKRKKTKKHSRQALDKGEKGSTSGALFTGATNTVTMRNASPPPTHDPPAIHTPSPSVPSSSHMTTRSLNELSPNQVAGGHTTTAGGIFNHASNFTLHNSSFVEQSINHYHQPPADAARAMERLLDHTLSGAAHDSSARDPPPRCHPGTRIRINERIVNWFYDAEKKEWLLWINGLAGVGKSAIVQTLAEKLALAKHLGASVFISRPRQCNDSQRIFLTIGYQLAEHIEAYYTFITAKLVRNPGLVNKGMKEQFQTFIVEPFVERKIGAGGNLWAILLDGLDELDTRQGQQEIIRLITSFVLEHPHLPLVWVIASRPEPHIATTFGQIRAASCYAEEEVPIDTTEAYKDVERYLNSSFETIRNNFPEIVPGEDWPSQPDVWALAYAASGLFTFAEFAIRFIGDMDYANPVTRLNHVLVAIDHAKAGSFEDWPFAYLDSLYARILDLIPPKVWPTTKRVFSVLLFPHTRRFGIDTLSNISLVLGLELGTIYSSFNSCTSILKIPPREDASKRLVTFYHASFGDYLLNSTRSGRFHISREDAEAEVFSSLIQLWQGFQAQYPPGLDSEYRARWDQFFEKYSSQLTRNSPKIDLLSRILEVFDHILLKIHTKQEGCFESNKDRDRCFDLLKQLDSSTVCQGESVTRARFVDWVFDIWTEFGEELASRGIICEAPFEQLRLDHLEWPTLYPRNTYVKQDIYAKWKPLQESCSREEDILGIKHFQQRCPQLPVLICGCPGKRFALLKDPEPSNGIQDRLSFESSICYEGALRYYIIPYPDPQNVQQFLNAKFATIRGNFPQIVPINWPIDVDFRKLVDAASDQLVFAATAIRFIEDRTHANPISRLEEVLSIVDGHNDEMSPLDALYTHVLSSIPSTKWPIMKRVLGALLYLQRGSLGLYSLSFQAICETLGLDQYMVRALFYNYSLVTVLPEKSWTYFKSLNFHHTSFVDYLTDPVRSKDFHISVESAREDVLWSILGENSPSSREHNRLSNTRLKDSHIPVESAREDVLRLIFGENSLSSQDYSRFRTNLPISYTSKLPKHMLDALLDLLVNNHDPRQPGGPFVSQEDRDRCFEVLGQLNAGIICAEFFEACHFRRFIAWVFDIWKMFQEELANKRIIREVEFAQLRFDHLDWQANLSYCTCARSPQEVTYILMRTGRVSDLKSHQESSPQLPVLICGSPGNRFALFEYKYTQPAFTAWRNYIKPPTSALYIIPYPDGM